MNHEQNIDLLLNIQSESFCPLADTLYLLVLYMHTFLVSLGFKQEVCRGTEDDIAIPRKMNKFLSQLSWGLALELTLPALILPLFPILGTGILIATCTY